MSLQEKFLALSAPFEPSEIKWKPQVLSKAGDKALAIPYIDARAVMDRLDAVLGVNNWQDSYTVLADKSVECRLLCRLEEGEWIAKCDVGGRSSQPDEGDKDKSAFSDALKRAAVKYGIFRYGYRLPQQWLPCKTYTDSSGKLRFSEWTGRPQLPDWATPAKQNGNGQAGKKLEQKTIPTHVVREAVEKSASEVATAEALGNWVMKTDKYLVNNGMANTDALEKHVTESGKRAGANPDLYKWTPEQAKLGAKAAMDFVRDCWKRYDKSGGKAA